MRCCSLKVLLISFIVSLILLIVSLVLALKIIPDIIDDQINEAVQLTNGSEQFDRFVELPFPIKFNVYLWNITNPEEIIQGKDPELAEVGPFKYLEWRKKVLYDINEEEDTITYRQRELFNFDENNTLPEDTEITTLNAPLISVLAIAETLPSFLSPIAYTCLLMTFRPDQRNMFIKATARELIFEGIEFCNHDEETFLCSVVNLITCSIAASKRNTEFGENSSLRFSFANYKNDTDDGLYEVKRGVKDVTTLGQIMKWEEKTYTDYFGNQTSCNEIKGCDSTIYPPRITTADTFFIFATDVCRTVEINYYGEGIYKDISGYKFGTDKNTLRSQCKDPVDDCFCIKRTKDINGEDNCYLDGLVDMYSCFGVPVLLSFPHFLWADEKYQKAIKGLSPDEEKHRIYLLVEPNTGIPLQGVKRIQINAVVRPFEGIKDLTNITRVILPLIWFEEGVELTDKYIDELNTSYFDMVALADGIRWFLVALFIVLTLATGGFWLKKKLDQKKNKKEHCLVGEYYFSAYSYYLIALLLYPHLIMTIPMGFMASISVFVETIVLLEISRQLERVNHELKYWPLVKQRKTQGASFI